MSGTLTPDQELAAVEALQNFFVALRPWIPMIIFIVVVFYAGGAYIIGRMFKKAGIPQWAAWIPGYNFWKYFEMGKQPPWIALLMLIPYIGIVASVFIIPATYHVNKGFGKSHSYLLMAYFLPVLWLGILAFGDDKWQPPKTKNKIVENN